jgi:hypothetical protein
MKRFSEQLHKQSQTVKLKKSEQADLRERLVSYMEYHPLPAAMKAADISNTKKAPRSAVLTEAFAQYAIPYQALFKFGSVAAVFVLLVVPFMAERTVPGDTLYAVKVQFNEEVRSTLTWGSYEKVEWETTRLNRRIAEARLLADEGLLTPEAEAEVAAAVREHSDNAKREIEVLRATDADEAAIATITFDSSLQVQAQVLQDGVDNTSTTTTDRGLISEALDESLEKPVQTKEAIIPAYGKLMARVEMNTTRVGELRDSLEGVVTDQGLVDVNRRIADIDRAITVAVVLAQNPDTELEARTALVDVLTRTQKLIVFMTDLEVREQVAIESVVPVVLTAGEIDAERTKRTTELTELIAQITAVIDLDEAGDLTEKLIDTSEKLAIAQEELLQTANYSAFVTLSDNAIALAKDSLILVEQQGVEVAVGVGTSTDAVLDDEIKDTASSTDEVLDENTQEEVITGTEEPATTTPVEIDTR